MGKRMNMTNFWASLASLLVLVAIVANASEEDEHFQKADVSSLMPSDNCSSAFSEASPGSMKLSPRAGPCSPLASTTATDVRDILRRDKLRVSAIQASLNSSSSDGLNLQASVPARQGAAVNTANYVITVSLGSSRRSQTLMFETGTSLTFVQCRPCSGYCYPQADPLFDPSSSTSIPCFSQQCNQLPQPGCVSNTCAYRVAYGDGSSSTGYLVRDTLTLASDQFPGFVFGCGQRNLGFEPVRAAGIAGLSRSALSLVSQTSGRYGRVFSYCLPTPTSGRVGDLTFGPVPGGGAVYYTPMLTDARDPSLYFLELTSISVAGQSLPVAGAVFKRAGTMIDSGTVITRLPSTAYAALRDAFRRSMGRYRLSGAVGVLDTCYDFGGQAGVYYPRVVLYFGGGTFVEMAFENLMLRVDSSHVCLAFAGNADDQQVAIIGNVQQAAIRIVYDLAASRIGFGAGACV